MTAVKLDDTGDIELDNGNLVLTTNDSDDEIIQRLRGRLQLFLGEWFLNTSIGIPYLQLVYRKGVDPEIISNYFKDEILATDGIQGITRFDPIEYDPRARRMTITFSVVTDNGNEEELTL